MADMQALRTAIHLLQKLLRQSADVPDDLFDAFRRNEIQLRRAISDQNATVASIGEVAFVSNGQGEPFRLELSRLRHAIALHNGSWPVVLIDLEDEQYKLALNRMREAYQQFFQWIHANSV